jgi:hypothetical protein
MISIIILQSVRFIFGVNIGREKVFLGGSGCKNRIDGSYFPGEKTKGCYPDIPILTKSKLLNVEVDENRHQFYNMLCELARYDSLMYGQDELRNTTCIRFNPHDCEGMTLPFVDRVRVLLQSIRNEMNVDVIDDTPKLIVKYFFYGDVCSCV